MNKFRFQVHTKFIIPAVALLLVCNPESILAETLPRVSIATASSELVVDNIPLSGSFVARQELHIHTRLSGVMVEQIHVEAGSVVNRGDILLEFDSTILANELERITTELIRSKAIIRRSRESLFAAEALLTQADSALKRANRLRKSQVISQSEHDERITAARAAGASFAIAKEDLAIAKAGHDIGVSRQELAVLNLSRTVIKSPVNALVISQSVHIGTVANPGGTPLLTLIVNNEIELNAEVMEAGLSRARIGDHVQLTLADGTQAQGQVRLISPTVDPLTRLGSIRVSMTNGYAPRLGSFAHGWLRGSEHHALLIPDSAVQSQALTGDTVAVVTNGVIKKRAVITGSSFHGQREVLQGLEAGEHVLLRTSSFYRDGDRVSVFEAQPTKNTTLPDSAQLRDNGDLS